MEVRSSEEARVNVKNFSTRFIELLKQKKQIDVDIKELKEEFKEEGVPVGIVTSTFNRLKAKHKKSDSQIFEEETIEEWMDADPEIRDGIEELNSKA